jgi:uncharacterized protein YdgA (DUF945 family)
VKKLVSIGTVLVVLLLGLWAAATYWFGTKTEQRYHALLKQASQYQYLKLLNESYSRGFLGSKARTVVEIHTPPGAATGIQPFRFTLAHDITHGPISFGKLPDGNWYFKPLMAIIETRLVLGPETQSQLAEVYAQVPEMASMRDYTVIHLDGQGTEHFLIPAFRHALGNENPATVDWKGLSFQVNFTADLKRFTGSFSVPGLEVMAKDGDLRIQEVKSVFDYHEGTSGVSLGDASFDIAGMEFIDKQGDAARAFFIRAFTINTSNKASGDNLNCVVGIRTEQVKVGETQYGPGIFEIELRNLDAASIARLQQAVRELQTQPQQPSAEQMQMMMLAKYAEILPGLLKKSPELEITQLRVKTSEGDFTGKAKIAFDGTKAESTQNLLALATALTAQAEFKVGEGLLHSVAASVMKENIIAEKRGEQGGVPSDQEVKALATARIDEQLNALVAQNILVKGNDNYQASASYKAGAIVLNGRPLPLQNLIR